MRATTALAVFMLAAAPPALSPRPALADACAGAKLKAIGGAESGLLACAAKAAKTGDDSILPACREKVFARLSATVAKAGPCDGPVAHLRAIATWCGSQVTDAIAAPAPSPCVAAGRKAAGGLAAGALLCHAKAAKIGADTDPACPARAAAKFSSLAAKAGNCVDGIAASALVGEECVLAALRATSPAGEGLAGGWSIRHRSGEVEGARFVHPVDADKDGAIVAARVASALQGLGQPATNDSRAASVGPVRMADDGYVDEVAAFIVDDLYGKVARAGDPAQPLLNTRTLVLSSVHRFGLYASEALHARFLPLQVLSFATDWDQVVAASRHATIIVGQDFDFGGLWLWNKLGAGAPGSGADVLPRAYRRAIAEAETLVVVQPDDNWTTCTDAYCWDVVHQVYGGAPSPVYLHTSLTRVTAPTTGRALYDAANAAGLVTAAPDAAVANLKQWEWGVPDSTVANLRALWSALGKPAENLVVLRGGVVDMYAWTPILWRRYLAANGRSPRGIHFLSYWSAFPQLERAGAVLPFPAYTFGQDDWHPLDDAARSLLADVCGGTACPAAFAANSRAFVNNVGGVSDRDRVRRILEDHGMGPATDTRFVFGINALGAGPSTGWVGEPVPPPWEAVALDLAAPALVPWTGAPWAPLGIDGLCAEGPWTCG